MASDQDLALALKNADAAGQHDDARQLAHEIVRRRNVASVKEYVDSDDLQARIARGSVDEPSTMESLGHFAKTAALPTIGGLVGSALPVPTLGTAAGGAVGEAVNQALRIGEKDSIMPGVEESPNWNPMAVGMAGGIPLAAGAAGHVGRFLSKDVGGMFTKSGQLEKLQAHLRELLGNDPIRIKQAIQALRGKQEIVPGSMPTAGNMLADTPGATSLIRFGDDVAGGAGAPSAQERLFSRQAARSGQMDSFAGTEAHIGDRIAARDDITKKLRDASIEGANEPAVKLMEGTKDLSTLEKITRMLMGDRKGLQQKMESGAEMNVQAIEKLKALRPPEPPKDPDALLSAVDKFGMPPKPLQTAMQISEKKRLEEQAIAGASQRRAAEDALPLATKKAVEAAARVQSAEEALTHLKPLTVDPIIRRINNLLKSDDALGSSKSTAVLEEIRAHLTKMGGETGIAPAKALDKFRREEIRPLIAKAREGLDKTTTAALAKEVRMVLDDALENAGGKDWKLYLKTYRTMSEDIDLLKSGKALQDALKRDGGESISKVAARFKSTMDELNAEGFLPEEELARAQRVHTDLQRQVRGESLGAQTRSTPEHPGGAEFQFPHFLSRKGAVANWILSQMGDRAKAKVEKRAQQAFSDPDDLAALLEAAVRTRQSAPWRFGVMPGSAGVAASEQRQ